MPGTLHAAREGAKRGKAFSLSLFFHHRLLWRQSSMTAVPPFCLPCKSSERDAGPRRAFCFATLELIQTRSSKKVLPLICSDCPAIWYVVGRLVLKSVN